MRIFLCFLLYNLLLLSLFLYTYFFSSSEIKIQYLKDVSGLNEEEALDVLKDYEITIEYVESKKNKDEVLYTKPYAMEMVYEKQMITLYVSKGYQNEKYQILENKIFKDEKEYLDKLVSEHKIELIVNYVTNTKMLDGLIYKQVTKNQYISEGDTLELYVVSNPKFIILPDFTGWNYIELLRFSYENDINIHIVFLPILYPSNHVISQSVLPGEAMLKNSNPITIYLSKEI